MSYRPYYEEKYIPDMTTWTSVAVSPFDSCKILRIGDTLYSFGGRDIGTGTDTGKIWTAPWDFSSNFTYSGTTVAALNNTPRSAACIIDSTIYNYGSTIWYTPISNPISGWATTNVSLTNPRDNYGFVVTPNYIGMYNGYNNGGFTNVNTASTSSPTLFSTLSTTAGSWERSACYLDDPANAGLSDKVIVLGGYLTTNAITFFDDKIANSAYLDTTASFTLQKNATMFHVGNKLYAVGSNNSKTMYYAYTNNLTQWYTVTNVMPFNTQYVGLGSWISKDGYAYIINVIGGIYRSNRKKIYVLDPPNPNGKYTHRRAVDDTGANTWYTIHCQMGMAPWFTNRRDVF